MRAMILAAGRGERLRPLTDRIPKPLLEAAGKPLLAWHLERLAAAGFTEVVINVAHLAERIVAAMGDGGAYGLRIAYSREAEPLETAGGIAHARELLGPDAFLLLNADVYCDCDLARLRRIALGSRLAHLVLAPNPAHRPGGDFSLNGAIVGNAQAPRYTYAGIAVVAPALVAPIGAQDKAPLAPLLRAAAERGQISGELYEGLWRDVGTAERLAELDALLRARHGAGL
ncbi:MAG TPA: nucleotidyltransferase family protein [Burkholderiales bacterium]|nr:nucleotidyltransferase family protein [Burkholderiales bacterium]